ncbi:MAG: arginase family protein [Ardenticatenaceae bacterium]|nr:arginase family protein [Ardenticatenaceae bacterium]
MKPILVSIPYEGGALSNAKREGSGSAAAAVTLFEHLKHHDIAQKLIDFDDQTKLKSGNKRDYHQSCQAKIVQAFEALLASEHLPITLGGDLSLRYPILKGVKAAQPHRQLGYIYFGPQLNLLPDQEEKTAGNAVGQLVSPDNGLIDGEKTVQLGWVADRTMETRKALQMAGRLGLTVIPRPDCEAVIEAIRIAVDTAFNYTDGVYISVDVGVIRAKDAPAVSHPNPLGLTPKVAADLITGLVRRVPLVGIDFLGASFSGQHPEAEHKTAHLITKIVEKTTFLIKTYTSNGDDTTIF